MKYSKNIVLALVLIIITFVSKAQTTIESIVIQKHNRNAVKLYIDQPQSITADALDAKLKRSGLSGKRNKGIIIYKGVTLSEISTTKLDIYTSVQEKGVGSVVYMTASKGYDNFASPEDTGITNNIIVFLNSFISEANYRAVDVDLTTQKDNLDKLEKAYQKLLDDQKDTEKKKSDAEVKLVQIQNDIDAKKIEIEKLKMEMDDLKIKRVNINQQ
jgi:hypothetical protein